LPKPLGPAFLNLRRSSLSRGNLLVLGSLLAAVLLSDFPHNRATLLLLLPTVVALAGTVETVRCIRRRWSFYHAGVILCIYMDLMAMFLILFFLIYPFSGFLTSAH
jgi:hypothetical protein